MDLPERSLSSQKAELIRALDVCRLSMEAGADEVASALDLTGQLRASFASGKWRWLVGSLVAGVVTGLVLTSRSRKPPASSPGAPKKSLLSRFAKTLIVGSFEAIAWPALYSLLQGKGEKWLRKILEKSQS